MIILDFIYLKKRGGIVKVFLILTEHSLESADRQDNKKGQNRMKIVLTLRTYHVPNVDNTIVRIPIWQETQTFETHVIGDFTIERTLTVYIAYKEDNGNIVPEIKFVE